MPGLLNACVSFRPRTDRAGGEISPHVRKGSRIFLLIYQTTPRTITSTTAKSIVNGPAQGLRRGGRPIGFGGGIVGEMVAGGPEGCTPHAGIVRVLGGRLSGRAFSLPRVSCLYRVGVAAMKEEFHTALYWRSRADEARALCDVLSDKDARTSMERIAQMYEDLAARTAEREARNSS